MENKYVMFALGRTSPLCLYIFPCIHLNPSNEDFIYLSYILHI